MENTIKNELCKNERFIQIPNNLIFVSKGELNVGVKPLVDTINYRVAYVISFIRANEKPFFGYSEFTLEDLVKGCGLKPSTKKGETNDMLKGVLLKLIELNIIEELDNSIVGASNKKVNAKSNMKCRLINEQKEGWFKVEPNEFISIMSYDGGKVDRMKLFNVFLCIKSTINPNTHNYSFISKTHVMNCLGVDKRALNSYLDILQNLGVLYNGYVCETVRNNEIKSRYVYATSEELLNQAIYKSKEYYIGRGYAVQTPNTILTNIAKDIFSSVEEEHTPIKVEEEIKADKEEVIEEPVVHEEAVEEEITNNNTDGNDFTINENTTTYKRKTKTNENKETDYSFLDEDKEDSWIDDMFDNEEIETEVVLTEEERKAKICEHFGVKVPTMKHIEVDKKAIKEEIAELESELENMNKNSIAYPFKKQRLKMLLSQVEEV